MRAHLQWESLEREFRAMFERRYFANNGPLVRKLDAVFAKRLGVAHAIACANAPVALALAAKALARGGGEALVRGAAGPPIVEALAWAGLQPRSDRSARTALVVVTSDASGEGIEGVPHITYATQRAFETPAACDATIYSLDGDDTTGGALGASIVTNRADLADQLKTMRNFHTAETFADVPLRMNAKMSECQAALALVALESWLASA